MFASRVRLLIAALWGGSLWTIGLVAAGLFSTLADRVLAGTIAGNLFRWEAWCSVAAGIVLLAMTASANEDARLRTSRLRVIGAMLVCTVFGYFALHPFMAALRDAAGPGGVMASDARMRFGVLHGLSSAFYLIESVLGAALILKSR